jgi:hypothetical protein
MSTRPFSEFQHTLLWRAVERAVADLQRTRELTVQTAPDYVIGYLCQELAARNVVAADALAIEPGR